MRKTYEEHPRSEIPVCIGIRTQDCAHAQIGRLSDDELERLTFETLSPCAKRSRLSCCQAKLRSALRRR